LGWPGCHRTRPLDHRFRRFYLAERSCGGQTPTFGAARFKLNSLRVWSPPPGSTYSDRRRCCKPAASASPCFGGRRKRLIYRLFLIHEHTFLDYVGHSKNEGALRCRNTPDWSGGKSGRSAALAGVWFFDMSFGFFNMRLFNVATATTVSERWSCGCANERDAEQGRQNGLCVWHGKSSVGDDSQRLAAKGASDSGDHTIPYHRDDDANLTHTVSLQSGNPMMQSEDWDLRLAGFLGAARSERPETHEPTIDRGGAALRVGGAPCHWLGEKNIAAG
jgi:hypothetical protein